MYSKYFEVHLSTFIEVFSSTTITVCTIERILDMKHKLKEAMHNCHELDKWLAIFNIMMGNGSGFKNPTVLKH